MVRPEGYRKAQRLIDFANKFSLPIFTFIDTAGAYPGKGAEERGQAEAIAKCIKTSLNSSVPIISVINGPGFHTEFPLLCDITLCADTAKFFEGHLKVGLVPGDGQFLVFQKLLGLKRANWFMYTAESFDAKQALEWGVINEVHSKDKLLDRAWELAGDIMKVDRVTRRVTAAVARRYWKRIFTDDFSHHVTSEMYAMMTSDIKNHGHGDQDLPEIFDDLKK